MKNIEPFKVEIGKMNSIFKFIGVTLSVFFGLIATAEAKLGGFEPQDGYAWYYQTDFHRYNAGQYNSSSGTETPPFQTIPINTGLWVSNAGLDPSFGGSYIGAHPGGRNGVAKMAIKSMSYSAGNFDMDYHFDSLDFDGNNPDTTKNATVEISYWFCPSVNNLPGVTDTISFFGANGNHLVSLGTKYDNASPRLVYSTTSHTAGWVDTGLNANPGDWDQVQLLITLSTTASDRLTLSFVSSVTGNTTVLLNDIAVASNIDALDKLKFTHNKDAINGKYYYDDFEFTLTNIQSPCDITGLAVTPGACNNNGTPNDTTDDYYNASVTVTFDNKPGSGNLVLSGAALHSTNSVSSVAVGSTTSATSHTFAGVRLKANGVANALTSTFSAEPDCTMTINPSAVGACSIPDCDMTNLVVAPGACNNNGTNNDETDDYFTADVTVSFISKPASGNLVLSGAALHASNSVTTVAVGTTTSAGSHTFVGVRLKANGVANAITATFSADPACTLTVNAPSVNECSTPDCDITNLVITPGACSDNSTPADATDDYYTASVAVTFTNKPASGNLVLSGVALHSTNSVTTVAVGSTTSATTHTFAGVRLKANGVANAITATFSADPACTMSINAPTVGSCSGGCPSYPPVADSITVACNTTVNKQLSTAGGVAPYTYAVTGGALPTGLSLTAGGLLSGDPTVVGTFNVTITVTDDDGCTGLINLEIIVSPCYSLGNLVWNDNGAGGGTLNDGIRNGAEPALANVLVELLDAAGNPYNPGTGVVTTTTNANGYYRFDNLPAGNYCVRVAASNFAGAAVLNGFISSGGQSTDFTVAGNNKDHGAPVAGAVTSTKVTLGASNPTGDKDAGASGAGDNGPEGDANDNLVVDFGFFVVPANCLVSNIAVTPGACNDNGTPANSADDYYTADVTVSYSNKPASGNLVLSGAALHSSNSVTTVPVGSTGASSHVFNGVRLKANGAVNTITATFSADVACTLTVDAPNVPNCSVPPCDITDLVVTPGACNDNGTPENEADDYFTANVSVTFTNKPASGNLVLSGVALHSTNSVSSVVVGSTTSATTHNFVGVRLKANGVANAITATFSADPACTMTVNTSVVPECSTPPAQCCPQIILGAP